ncbi:MAG: FAD:protein FMN transferase [Sphingomonadaceae bacterium]|nr:FAD:protein FMN transferase [Sphingomonadaceae bacterium]
MTTDVIRRCRPLLGTFVEITADRANAIDAAFAVVARVHARMSAHDPASDLGRANASAHRRPVAVDPWTAEVVAAALRWAQASDGGFDPTIGGRQRARGWLPVHAGDPAPDPAATWRDVTVTEDGIAFARPLALDLGGIAKGFAVDQALAALRDAGAAAGLVNAGGDMAAFGAAWPVTLVDPLTRAPVATIALRDSALATSAGVRGGSGLDFAHLPHRAPALTSATVAAPACRDADVLAKLVIADHPRAAACLAAAGAEVVAVERRRCAA